MEDDVPGYRPGRGKKLREREIMVRDGGEGRRDCYPRSRDFALPRVARSMSRFASRAALASRLSYSFFPPARSVACWVVAPPLPDRLHLVPVQDQPALEVLEDMVLVPGPPVGGDRLLRRRLLHFRGARAFFPRRCRS